MNSFAEKAKENNIGSPGNVVTQQRKEHHNTFQFKDNRNQAIVQRKLHEMADTYTSNQKALQKKANRTGLPDQLKTGIEHLSGLAMDDVKVHYNSNKPSQLQAHAYAQGTDIHIASGQEKHVPHEAWHVVQQKQGRVKPTMQLQGKVNINDDAGLEKEADIMGQKALRIDNKQETSNQEKNPLRFVNNLHAPFQLMKKWTKDGGFEDIEQAPEGKWLRCMYKGEETYISDKDMAEFDADDWDHITYYPDEAIDGDDLSSSSDDVDKFPGFEVGQVTSITVIKESRSDHQYVIAMVKGGNNIKMHFGVGGSHYERSDDIDNEHGVPVAHYGVPEGLTGDEVMEIFHSKKEGIAKKFTGGNCGGLAAELVDELGGINL